MSTFPFPRTIVSVESGESTGISGGRMNTPNANEGPAIVLDLDGTLTNLDPAVDYADVTPRADVVEKVREYAGQGFRIIICTSRNMRTYANSVGHINANTLPIVIEWLRRHDIPFDEIHVGKPWCGNGGFYIDDKTIRPDEFVSMSYPDIQKVISDEVQ